MNEKKQTKKIKTRTCFYIVLVYKKLEKEDNTKYDNFNSSSKAEIIINKSDINDVL